VKSGIDGFGAKPNLLSGEAAPEGLDDITVMEFLYFVTVNGVHQYR